MEGEKRTEIPTSYSTVDSIGFGLSYRQTEWASRGAQQPGDSNGFGFGHRRFECSAIEEGGNEQKKG